MVSIGMPVYNGERFIRQALDSLLAQDYENFELIISDNASTDQTQEISLEYVAKDKRIRYYRNQSNLGSVNNFNRVLDLSRSKYFMWAGDHDLWHPTLISRCISILETDLEVVLVYPRTMLIDTDGNNLGLTSDQIDTRGLSPLERFKYIVFKLGWCNMMYGVIRTEQLGHTGKVRNVWGTDNAMLAELSLLGSFAQIPDALFFRRKNRPDLPREMHKRRVLDTLDPITASERSKQSFDSLHRELGRVHLQIVSQAPFSFRDRLRANYFVIWRFWLKRPWQRVLHIAPPKLRSVARHKIEAFKIAKK